MLWLESFEDQSSSSLVIPELPRLSKHPTKSPECETAPWAFSPAPLQHSHLHPSSIVLWRCSRHPLFWISITLSNSEQGEQSKERSLSTADDLHSSRVHYEQSKHKSLDVLCPDLPHWNETFILIFLWFTSVKDPKFPLHLTASTFNSQSHYPWILSWSKERKTDPDCSVLSENLSILCATSEKTL